ncbi:MAG: ferritin-like domain-containing protein [Candidatus Bathyarchaeota archaeon]|nr:ferritin-like domain-containing protein [Candidatus Bathyarchaeota archaeon]
MTSKELLEIMNKGIAREIQVSVQYMWQHVLWKGISGFAVKDELKDIAITEMKHAEAFAERLSYLGGTPTIKPDPINVRDELKDMIEQDKKDEEGAIDLYKQGIEIAMKEGDLVTAELFRDTLEDEEEHHDFFTSLLEDM